MVADDSLRHASLDPSTQQSFELRWERYLPVSAGSTAIAPTKPCRESGTFS